jgi:hypothetical protein
LKFTGGLAAVFSGLGRRYRVHIRKTQDHCRQQDKVCLFFD